MGDDRGELHPWQVGGGVIERDGLVLLVCNRRRDGLTDWSPPGGVIDPGEDLLQGLTREVAEETGLAVNRWTPRLYSITATAPDMGWRLQVGAHLALETSGEIVHDDPDGIVVDHHWATSADCIERLSHGPRWVSEPLLAWLGERWTGRRHFEYLVRGSSRADLEVVALPSPDDNAAG